jgi:N-acetylglucosamine malate deacetylase 1
MIIKNILIVAPHADDETLGCGGTILRAINEGHNVHWLLVTGMSSESGFSLRQIETRKNEIEKVSAMYGFTSIHELNLAPATLETLPKGDIIGPISSIINKIKPDEIYTVYRNDAHSDHEIVFDAVMSSSKSFRQTFIKRILAYETMSETDFGMKPEDGGFRPNAFIDISLYLNKKLDILEQFESEIGEFPFPRSRKALESLAYVRGVQSNFNAAEAFMLLKEVI